MNPLITALAPVFAAALVVQQSLEILDVPIGGLAKMLPGEDKVAKSYLMSFLSLSAGLIVAWGFGLHAFEILLSGEQKVDIPTWLDIVATALLISGGTEGTNSIVKFLGYTKEKNKGEAAKSLNTSEDIMDKLHQ